MSVEKRQPPQLGARVRASGYMARYLTHQTGDYGQKVLPPEGCKGWKRKGQPVSGAYIGIRFLGITWWHEREYFHAGYCDPEVGIEVKRGIGHVRVYAIAINHRAIRYVLPRDVEAVS